MRYKTVVFDFDGTLADTFPVFIEGMNKAAGVFGYPLLKEEHLPSLRRLSARAFIKTLGISSWKLPLIGFSVKRHLSRNVSNVSLFDSIPEVLKELKARGVTLVILTSNSPSNVRRILGISVLPTIDVFCCNAGIHGKAGALQRLLKKKGWHAADVLSVGDEIRDAEAAKEAAVDFVGVSWGFTDPESLKVWSKRPLFQRPEDLLVLF